MIKHKKIQDKKLSKQYREHTIMFFLNIKNIIKDV
jgi:hypothetical protein